MNKATYQASHTPSWKFGHSGWGEIVSTIAYAGQIWLTSMLPFEPRGPVRMLIYIGLNGMSRNVKYSGELASFGILLL